MEQLITNIDSQGVAWVSLNRPEKNNAFDEQMIQALQRTFTELGQNSQVRVVILQGSGKHFCAGADLSWMQRSASFSEDENYRDAMALTQMLSTLQVLAKPTIALVQGACFGGAVGLVSCCDIVIASKSAQFCLSEVKLGLMPAAIAPYVVAAIGKRQSLRYMQTAEPIEVEQALVMELVHEVVANNDALTGAAQGMVKQLLNNAPGAVMNIKALLYDLPLENAVEEEVSQLTARKIAGQRSTAEAKEGLSAFFEKRPAAWCIKDKE